MPIYEYRCETCDHKFEVKQKFSDPPVDSCIQCGKSVRKLISAAGIMFKGTGWYVTDYSDKMKDPNKSLSSKGTDTSKENANGGSESSTSKDTAASDSSSTSTSKEGGNASSSKETSSSKESSSSSTSTTSTSPSSSSTTPKPSSS